MPSCRAAQLLDILVSVISPRVAEASADLIPWGFVAFCAIVLLISHLRLPRR